jgi:hypothetical protein
MNITGVCDGISREINSENDTYSFRKMLTCRVLYEGLEDEDTITILSFILYECEMQEVHSLKTNCPEKYFHIVRMKEVSNFGYYTTRNFVMT